jgi:hypothetical protein
MRSYPLRVHQVGNRAPDQPSSYRIYDYLLGGSFNLEVDREFARQLLTRVPWASDVARANRAFLVRAVRFAVSRGIRQFLDLGSGIVAASRVDRVAQELDANCRVAYVDSDPIAVAHAEVMTAGDRRSSATLADLRDVPAVLAERTVAGVLDFGRPVGVLMAKVVHMIPDEDKPADIVAGYRDAVPAGSMLAITHATMDDVPGEVLRAAPMWRNSAEGMHDRPHATIESFLAGWDVVEPGLVFTSEWRPDEDESTPAAPADPGWSVFLAAVGVKPGR